MKKIIVIVSILLLLSACGNKQAEVSDSAPTENKNDENETFEDTKKEEIDNSTETKEEDVYKGLPKNLNTEETFEQENLREIYLAGGCFWGVEAYMARVYGVYDSVSGYANGGEEGVSYKQVVNGSGHAETVKVTYDITKTDLGKVLDMFFKVVDPTSVNKQGNDVGISYRSGIYYVDEADLDVINAKIEALKKEYSQEIVTEVLPLTDFTKAEDYHQDYLERTPGGYCHIPFNDIVEQNYDILDTENTMPDAKTLREQLTPLQYEVALNCGTEKPFDNEYYDNYEKGIYVDIITGEPLFSSSAKYNSMSGWPSFFEPIDENSLLFIEDTSYGMVRTEVKSEKGNTHLGHVFPDGPEEEGGLRYCINSASLKFIPYEEMDAQGYSEYKKYVEPEVEETTTKSTSKAPETAKPTETTEATKPEKSPRSEELNIIKTGETTYHEKIILPVITDDAILAKIDRDSRLDGLKEFLSTNKYNFTNGSIAKITNEDSYYAICNKLNSYPSSYVPGDLYVPNVLFSFNNNDMKKNLRKVAGEALEELFRAAMKEDIELFGVSGYRSYDRQNSIYSYNVSTRGVEETDKVSARPGHSEHQSGLTIDVSSSSAGFDLVQSFGSTDEGIWLANNCHKYGFIIRYPYGKENITGYSYEPWHIRYIGKDLASFIDENNLTLEELYYTIQRAND